MTLILPGMIQIQGYCLLWEDILGKNKMGNFFFLENYEQSYFKRGLVEAF